MSGYAPEPGGEQFARSRACFAELEEWLAGADAAALAHAELGEQMDARGRELLRLLHQDHLDLRAAREQRRAEVPGADGITRTRVEAGHRRRLATVFGEVTVTWMAYRAPGAANLHPADAALNLPEERHSHVLRRLAATESARARSSPPLRPSPGPPGSSGGSARWKSLPSGPQRTWTRSIPAAGPARGPMTSCWC